MASSTASPATELARLKVTGQNRGKADPLSDERVRACVQTDEDTVRIMFGPALDNSAGGGNVRLVVLRGYRDAQAMLAFMVESSVTMSIGVKPVESRTGTITHLMTPGALSTGIARDAAALQLRDQERYAAAWHARYKARLRHARRSTSRGLRARRAFIARCEATEALADALTA